MFDRRLIQNFDWVLLILVVIIASVGLVNLYSATSALREMGRSNIFIRQVYWFLIGLGLMLLMMTFDYHLMRRFAYILYLIGAIFLVLVLFHGETHSGSQRWMKILGVAFQPSEFMKITLVLALARYLDGKSEVTSKLRLRDLWIPFILTALPCFLIIKEPDLGTSLIIVVIATSMILFVGIDIKSIIMIGMATLGIAPFVWYNLAEYQKKRILTFLNPDMDPLGAGYHITQSKIAIGSGLLWGKGYLKGTQTRLRFLPEQHTDFAFSVFAEEWGFLGAIIVLILYLLLILWCLNIARNSKDRFGSLVAIGIASIFFWQCVVNVGMTTGLLPVVGVPLVFFSYGGSAMLSMMMGVGILMSISMRRFMFQ